MLKRIIRIARAVDAFLLIAAPIFVRVLAGTMEGIDENRRARKHAGKRQGSAWGYPSARDFRAAEREKDFW